MNITIKMSNYILANQRKIIYIVRGEKERKLKENIT